MDRTPTAMTPKAPGAATPGYGAGNVPFAPGVISGRNLGQQNTSAQTPHPQGGVTLNVNAGPPPEKGPGLPPTPTGPMQPQTAISPEAYFKFLDAYMGALQEAVKSGKPLVGGIY